MVPDLREAFHLDNLHHAWRWLNTNDDRYFKGYFRHIYRAYAMAIDENLNDLHKRLMRGSFQPGHATKLYLPKKSGIQRTYTLLNIEDQIVYQAITNVIAERLLPKMQHQYYKEVFGNLYAGQRSKYFYRPWRKGYKRFGDSIRVAFKRGFVFTASFDLTACYDSIDHSVLSHFLADLGLDNEFIKQLCDYLKLWTAALAETRIYQGHGIPQGPLSSGLLSEVVLRYFDENYTEKPRAWRYFRYVDDIRFFAKNVHDLRAMLVEMDLLSKQIGLFPQSGKIEIHRVVNIEDEIKSISDPTEPVDVEIALDQKRVQRQLKELSPHFEITNSTRFKYILGSAQPNAALSNRLLKILTMQPHFYVSIFNYFEHYALISKQVSMDLFAVLRENGLYAAFTAAGLRVLRDHGHSDLQPSLDRFAKSILEDRQAMSNSELRAAAVSILLKQGKMTWRQTVDYFSEEQEWWPRSEVIKYVQLDHVGKPSFGSLINDLLTDSSVDVSIVAAEFVATHSLALNGPIDTINPIAQLALKKMGLIQARRGRICPIRTAMQHMLGSRIEDVTWPSILGRHYQHDVTKAITIRAYSETDATSWVNILDTFHDDLLDSLYDHEAGAIGTYQHGNIGGALSSATSRFAVKYPKAFRVFREFHEKRLESALSHSVNRATGKRTRFIEFRYIKQAKKRLANAYLEIWNNW